MNLTSRGRHSAGGASGGRAGGGGGWYDRWSFSCHKFYRCCKLSSGRRTAGVEVSERFRRISRNCCAPCNLSPAEPAPSPLVMLAVAVCWNCNIAKSHARVNAVLSTMVRCSPHHWEISVKRCLGDRLGLNGGAGFCGTACGGIVQIILNFLLITLFHLCNTFRYRNLCFRCFLVGR